MNPVNNLISETSSPKATNRPRSVESASPDEPYHKKHRTKLPTNLAAPIPSSLTQCPFTDAFFAEMAGVIQDTFPITSFAETYHCSPNDVLDALRAVALKPLCTSSIPGLSVSEHAQIAIADWRETVAKVSQDIIILSDNTPPSTASSVSPTPKSLDCVPLSDPRPPSVFTSPLQQPSSASSSPNISNSRLLLAGEGISPQQAANSTAAALKKEELKYPNKPSNGRVEVRRDYSGVLIPAADWIDGYHIPKRAEPLQAERGDGMTDEEFEIRMQVGWFSEFLEEKELDQVACAKPGLKRCRRKK
ncbi:hypothetical protein F1880_006777 [Penicillium rolfsii]|nr:hypothetical protein F1880_006777 [Penicillium rolfsii]